MAKLIDHSNHILQTLDVGVFRKAEWKKAIEQYIKDIGFRDITKTNLKIMFLDLKLLVFFDLIKRLSEKINLGIAFNVQVEGSFIANTQATSAVAFTLPTTSAQALTLKTLNSLTLFFWPALKRLSRYVKSNKTLISAVNCQNKGKLNSLFENHLKELTQCTNKIVTYLQAAVESVFKWKYARPRKEFDN